MTMIRKLVRAQINVLGDDEVEVVMSTAALARDGHVLVPQGCLLDNYRANPIVLWSHDPDKPIGNAENIVVGADQVSARIRFAPLGISLKADEIRGLMKSGVIRAVSVGFDPVEMEPLDPKRPRGGQRIASWELLELSAVSVPADTGAMVTARAHGETDMPQLTEPEAGTDAEGAQDAAEGPQEPAEGAARAVTITFQRGLYQVAQLCCLFEELGWQLDMAKWESAIEGDASKVPGMLAAVLHDLGDALLAMTEEEVAEALAGHDVEPDVDPDEDDDATPAVRAFRRGFAQRAGKALSAETMRCLYDAQAMHKEAITIHRSAIAKHKQGMAVVDDLMDRAGVSDAEDGTADVQTSDGTAVSEGADNGRMRADFRRRDADILFLRAQ